MQHATLHRPSSSRPGRLAPARPVPAARATAPAVVRRQGRPYRLPEDPTPLTAATTDPVSRVAWLLGASRTHGPDDRFATREGFLPALQEEGIAVDPTRLSRWESGRAPVPVEALAAYERLLRLPAGRLSVTATAALLSQGRAGALDAEAEEAHRRLDSLFAATLGGDAAPQAWLDLGEAVTRGPRVYLLPETWARVCDLLADELLTARGLDLTARFETLRLLVGHGPATRHAVKAIGRLVTSPDAEFVVQPLSLLQAVSEPQADGLLFKLLGDVPGHRRAGAAWAVSARLAQGRIAEEDLPRVAELAVQMLQRATRPLHRLDALALLAHLPAELASLAGLDESTRTWVSGCHRSKELHGLDAARTLSMRIAERVQLATPSVRAVEPDRMLQRLVRELLAHTSPERRYQAAVMLAASPYRPRLGDELLALAATTRDETLAATALTGMFLLADEGHRDQLLELGLGDRPVPVRALALMALGQVSGALSDAEVSALMAVADEPGLGVAARRVLGG
ncbi:hypothetical protein [Nocardioides ferulae]|uniref:hypothetical protein n=1 Tax=Nocardioides ferulae TaxID=2340821 RepID=UPI000EB5939C|nr:hypothetical protein [Nocardioides ferulae]